MAKEQQTLFQRLSKLFKSGPIVKRKIRTFDTTIAAADKTKSSGALLFQKSLAPTYATITSNAYNLSERLMRYQDFQEMEYCLHADTKIAIPGGYKTIGQLAKDCEGKPDYKFIVYSYDHNEGRIIPALGKQARQTRIDHAYTVVFDNGQKITGTSNHRLMKRDGTFCKIEDLKPGNVMMPFYRKTLFNDCEGDIAGGEWIYSNVHESKTSGWTQEHKMIQTFMKGPTLTELETINYEHLIENNNNVEKRKDITFGKILETSENVKFDFYRLCTTLDIDSSTINYLLHKNGYQNFETFANAYNDRKYGNKEEKDARYNASISFDDFKVAAIEYYGVIPLYDLTVDGYKNFATDTVISHNTPEIAAAMDIYADETVAQDDKGRVLHIYSDNEKIKNILEDLFYNTLNVEFNLRSWARNLVKYGDFFLYNDVSPEYGVINAFPIPVNEIEREENYDPNDPFAVRFRWVTLGNRTLENWEVTHFRLLGNDMFLPYGSSVVEPARRIWRQLILIEDAMLVYRVVRAPERRVFYIDVANIPPENVPMYVEEQRKNLRTNQVVDKATGRLDLRYAPLSIEDDYFIPVRGGESGTKIDTLAGGQNAAAIEDVAYIQKKLFAALKVPRAYLGYDEMLSCVVPETPVDLLDGRTLTVEQIKGELDDGKPVWVYSVDEETLQMKPGRVVWAGQTRKNASLVRVTIDNGMSFDCTPDHKWMLRDGSWCQAGELKQNASLMPVDRRLHSMNGGRDYEQVFDPASGNWKWTHRLVADSESSVSSHPSCLDEKVNVIHHIDVNRFNNNPENLIRMGFDAHRQLHVDDLAKTRSTALLAGKYNGLNNGWAKKCRDKVSHLWNIQTLISWCLKNRPTSKRQIMSSYGLHETQFDRLLSENSLNYQQFAESYVNGGYKLARLGIGNYKNINYKRISGKFVVAECVYCNSHIQFNVNTPKKFCNLECYQHFGRGKKAPKPKFVRDGLINHKVISVEVLSEKRDTWCIEVAGTHTFGLSKSVIISNSKATLAQEDIRFSRTINVIQKVLISELNKLAIVHLYANGFDGEDLQNFNLQLSNPSTVAQQQKLELWRSKFEIAGTIPEGMGSKEFARKMIWGLTDEQIKEIDEQRYNEKIVDAAIEAAKPEESEGEEPAADAGEEPAADAGEEPAADAETEDLFAGDDIDEKEPTIDLLTSSDEPDLMPSLYEKDKLPVKPMSRLKKAIYDSSRRKKYALHEPDFVKMTSHDGNGAADIYDSNWMKSIISDPFKESKIQKVETFKTALTPDLQSTLTKMSTKLQINKNNHSSKLLYEEKSLNDEKNNILIIDED